MCLFQDVIILDGLIEVVISILNQVGELLDPKTFITSGSIDWNAILPFSHPKVDHLAVNVVSLCDSTFPKVHKSSINFDNQKLFHC